MTCPMTNDATAHFHIDVPHSPIALMYRQFTPATATREAVTRFSRVRREMNVAPIPTSRPE